MKTTTFADFDKEYTAFAIKHNRKSERHEETFMDEYGIIRKTVWWDDGATWWEITETEHSENVEVELHGIKVKVNIPLRRTEYWSTEDSRSKYFYTRA